jgi:hypothetical protein
MREGITLSAGDRGRLEAVVADRNSPQSHVWRAQIVLRAGDGLGNGGDHAARRQEQERRQPLVRFASAAKGKRPSFGGLRRCVEGA